ncbi:MAG: DUF4336 domain-containing protein [Pseudomonadales bacterium]|nr:DUF4336 domain-containing protein [Pseudomonadales bacterium]
MSYKIEEYIQDKIYIVEYPIRFAGMDLFSRMTIVKLSDGKLWVHSPSKLGTKLKTELAKLGDVAYIIAPGNYHHLNVAEFQSAYPSAETYLCPSLESKRADLEFDWILGNRPDSRWENEFEQVVIHGTRIINEVAFYHLPTKTLILVDLIENIGDNYTHEAGLLLQFWWKAVFKMWNNPKAAPEYQLGWGDKSVVKKSLEKILSWDFEKIILAHGNLIENDAHAVAKKAWENVLQSEESV